jgi:hypothetical protein
VKEASNHAGSQSKPYSLGNWHRLFAPCATVDWLDKVAMACQLLCTLVHTMSILTNRLWTVVPKKADMPFTTLRPCMVLPLVDNYVVPFFPVVSMILSQSMQNTTPIPVSASRR